jgi:hypothetical protein
MVLDFELRLPRRLPSAILRRSKRAIWSSIPAVSWHSWAVVAAVVKRSELAARLAELLAQMKEVRGLTSEPFALLYQHCRDAPEATRSLTRSIPGLFRLALLCPGSYTFSMTS